MKGHVNKVLGEKGFGFITGEDSREYFFHRTDISGFFNDLVTDVDKGEIVKVTFDPDETSKGPRARNVIVP